MTLIAAVDENWAIGRNGDQLLHLKGDLKRFRALTFHKTILLGRKTLLALPGGRPLKDRKNMILSTTPGFSVENAQVFSSLEQLLAAAPPDSVVIGGGTVYAQLLPYCTTAWITKIHHSFPADTWFPNLDTDPNWSADTPSPLIVEQNVSYQYITYHRIRETILQ